MPRKSHRLTIYENYRDKIQRGEIGQSDRLVDTVIAAKHGVSRMPVREALMQLVHEGYLEGTARGFTLPKLSRNQIIEIFELRRLLEPRAAASAAQVVTPEDAEILRQAVDEALSTLETQDMALFFQSSEVFRSTWLGLIPNNELRQTILRYLAQVQTVRMKTMRLPKTHILVIKGQISLYDAFVRNDALAAGDRMLRFVIQAEDSFLNRVPPSDPSTHSRPELNDAGAQALDLRLDQIVDAPESSPPEMSKLMT